MRLIDADKLRINCVCVNGICVDGRTIENAPTVKAIPIELYEQIKGERDVAIEQLKALNIELFEKPYLKAIPIEWIKKWCNKEHNRKSLEERLLKRYGVITMLEDWEKENEID